MHPITHMQATFLVAIFQIASEMHSPAPKWSVIMDWVGIALLIFMAGMTSWAHELNAAKSLPAATKESPRSRVDQQIMSFK